MGVIFYCSCYENFYYKHYFDIDDNDDLFNVKILFSMSVKFMESYLRISIIR